MAAPEVTSASWSSLTSCTTDACSSTRSPRASMAAEAASVEIGIEMRLPIMNARTPAKSTAIATPPVRSMTDRRRDCSMRPRDTASDVVHLVFRERVKKW